MIPKCEDLFLIGIVVAVALGFVLLALVEPLRRLWVMCHKPSARCAASTCENRPWRWCRYGHCLDHCRKFEQPKCNCPLPPIPAAPHPVDPPAAIDGKVW